MQVEEERPRSDAGAGDRPGTNTPHSVSHATGSDAGRVDVPSHRERRPARPALAPESMRANTAELVRFMQNENIKIDRRIARADLGRVLLFREALRSLERFSEADAIRQELAAFGFVVRDEERASKTPSYFVILSEYSRRCIIDRGWVPTYSLMQQYLLHQCNLEKVLQWMWADSDEAGIGQYSRQTEEPTEYRTGRGRNPYVIMGSGSVPCNDESLGHGGKGKGTALPNEAVAVARAAGSEQDEPPAPCKPALAAVAASCKQSTPPHTSGQYAMPS